MSIFFSVSYLLKSKNKHSLTYSCATKVIYNNGCHLSMIMLCETQHLGNLITLFLSFFLIFIVIQLQLYAFSPHPSTPPQLNPPPSPTSTLPLDFVRVWGQWEEGITGTTIKDTWTKSMGRVEVGEGGGFSCGGVEGWGEKAYNCNWITIKFKKKQTVVPLHNGILHIRKKEGSPIFFFSLHRIGDNYV